jgi:hypothetical protein
MEITQNGAPHRAMITTSWARDDYANGRRRYKLYAMAKPETGGSALVIGEAVLEVPNLEVAKIVVSGLTEMLVKQGPEILQVKP